MKVIAKGLTTGKMRHKMLEGMAAILVLLALTVAPAPAEMKEFPKPAPEHAWLQQFVGEWRLETQAVTEPGKPPEQSQGTERIQPLGPFWTVSEIKGTMMNRPFTGNLTLGYDAEKKKYVGTWIDSMTGQLWQYEGALDATGKILTLESQGACPMRPGKLTRFKEVIEMKSPDHKIYTSAMQDDNGQWMTTMTSQSWRVK